MMGSECGFCGSEFWDDETHCYGCRLTLPALFKLGHFEVKGYLLGHLTADTAKEALRKASAVEAMPKPCLSLGCDGYVGHPGKCPFIDEAGEP